MRLVLTGRHVEISPGLRTLADRKLARLERQLGNAIVSAQVVFAIEKGRRKVDLTVHMRGDHMLSGHADGRAWPAALTAAIDKIERQGHRVKGKWGERKRQATRAGTARRAATTTIEAEAAEPPPQVPRVVRIARTQHKPMSVESAALELDARGDAYLVFRNVETDALNVLVRRKGGDYGLIEPEA